MQNFTEVMEKSAPGFVDKPYTKEIKLGPVNEHRCDLKHITNVTGKPERAGLGFVLMV